MLGFEHVSAEVLYKDNTEHVSCHLGVFMLYPDVNQIKLVIMLIFRGDAQQSGLITYKNDMYDMMGCLGKGTKNQGYLGEVLCLKIHNVC